MSTGQAKTRGPHQASEYSGLLTLARRAQRLAVLAKNSCGPTIWPENPRTSSALGKERTAS